MKKEITLEYLAESLEKTAESLEKTKQELKSDIKSLEKSVELTNKTVDNLAVMMSQGFGRVYHEIQETKTELNSKIDSVKTGLEEKIETTRVSLDSKIDSVKVELSDKIESEVGNLAGMCKREFDEIGFRFNRVDNEFKEVHEEIGQASNNVIGIERRLAKLEKNPSKG